MIKLDRTAHHAGTFEGAELYHARTQPSTPTERLRAANYIISAAYGIDSENPPKMDRTYGRAISLDHRENDKSI